MVVLRMILARKIMHPVLRQHHPLGKLVPQLAAVDCCQYRGSDLEKREDDEQDTPYQPRGRVRAARATETKRTMANRAVHRHAPCADEHRNASLDCDAHRPAHEAAAAAATIMDVHRSAFRRSFVGCEPAGRIRYICDEWANHDSKNCSRWKAHQPRFAEQFKASDQKPEHRDE